MEKKKPISNSAYQKIGCVSFPLLIIIILADILYLKFIYGNLLGEGVGMIVLDVVIFFVLWMIIMLVFKSLSDVDSFAENRRKLKEGGGVDGLLARSRENSKNFDEKTKSFYKMIAAFLLAIILCSISFGIYIKTGDIPLKISLIGLAAAGGFLVFLVQWILKKSDKKQGEENEVN